MYSHFKLSIWTFAATACFSTAQARAGQHFICYQGPPELRDGQWFSKAVAGCHDDSGQPCSVDLVTPTFWGEDKNATASAARVSSIGNFKYYEFGGSGSGAGDRLELKAIFTRNNPNIQFNRFCTVQARGTSSVEGYTEGVLTGFSSDDSGLVSTGVWRINSYGDNANLYVPLDFVVSGGGFQSSTDAFISKADFGLPPPDYLRRQWTVTSRTRNLGMPRTTTAYAVGLRIHGLKSSDLVKLIDVKQGFSAMQPQTLSPFASVLADPGKEIVGGGIRTPPQFGQFATTTAPINPTFLLCSLIAVRPVGCGLPDVPRGWSVQSKDATGNFPGSVEVNILTLPSSIIINGKKYFLLSRYMKTTSSPGYQSTATVNGMRGEFAVTNAGAATRLARNTPSASSSLLTEVIPMLNEGGAQASATHTSAMGTPASGAVTAYVNGIKLVPFLRPFIRRPPFPFPWPFP